MALKKADGKDGIEESEEDFIVRREPLKCCSDLDKDHGLVA